jgi:hypothetical protein
MMGTSSLGLTAAKSSSLRYAVKMQPASAGCAFLFQNNCAQTLNPQKRLKVCNDSAQTLASIATWAQDAKQPPQPTDKTVRLH